MKVWLCLMCNLLSAAATSQCSGVPPEAANSPVLLQVKTKGSRARINRSKTREDDCGECEDTSGDAVFDDDDGPFSCEDYADPYTDYCDEADDDFSASSMCCVCNGGQQRPKTAP